ncbi:LCP family protein [Deinococcus arenicola]|uniref:LCP family protein n=1 Tax=Deinococcus arenicola TaxID=2994950 RepID=A0ABU4DRY2_9DEIO|nr:LCP family protein [Deinococcus sp. ZS9-10]MDV6374630.1 LCP family protein [Deinococcus sp. ZS9-10]
MTAPTPTTPPRALGRLRAVQTFGLSLAALTLGGLALLQGAGGASRLALAAGTAPQYTVLLAGRDIVYCYYHQPCKDQDNPVGALEPPNTDTLMLVKVDGSRVRVLNIPRDTNVGPFDPTERPSIQKVNSRYGSGGPDSLTRAVETVVGERVDSYVVVRTDYVERVIDALGGLDVTVPEGGIEWVDNAAGVNLKLRAGPHHLKGKVAVLYLRVRKGFGDDYGRIDHQKQALAQLAAKLRSPRGLAALPTILGGVGDGVQTNADPELLTALRPYLSNLKLSFATLPTDTIPGSFNLAVNRGKLAQLWGDQPAAASPSPSVRVSVADASGAGLGRALQDALKTLGYTQVTVRTQPRSREASQVFTDQDVADAGALADLLSLPRLQGERFPVEPGEVGILLGMDAREHLAALFPFAQLPVPPLSTSRSSTSRPSTSQFPATPPAPFPTENP